MGDDRAIDDVTGDAAAGDSGQEDSAASNRRFRLAGRATSTEFDYKQLNFHMLNFFIIQVEHQLQSFVLRFFNFFVTFVKEDQHFVQIMKNLSALYAKTEWNGIVIIRGEGIEVAVYYEKLEFRVSGEKFDMEISVADADKLEGAGFVQKLEKLVEFLTDHVSTHSKAVEVFPSSADEIKSNICSFNPV